MQNKLLALAVLLAPLSCCITSSQTTDNRKRCPVGDTEVVERGSTESKCFEVMARVEPEKPKISWAQLCEHVGGTLETVPVDSITSATTPGAIPGVYVINQQMVTEKCLARWDKKIEIPYSCWASITPECTCEYTPTTVEARCPRTLQLTDREWKVLQDFLKKEAAKS